MRITLGKMILAPAILAAMALATHSANAETVKVPFSFTAAGKFWPAGVYTVQRNTSGTTVTIKCTDNSQSFAALLGPGDASSSDSRIALNFDASTSTHMLRSIQYGPLTTGRLDSYNIGNKHLTSSGR